MKNFGRITTKRRAVAGYTAIPAGSSSVVASPDYLNTLAVAAATVPLTVNGNADGEYLVQGCCITNNGPNQNLQILLNGAATNMRARVSDILVGSSYITNGWVWGNTGPYGFAVATTFTFTGRLTARTGRIREIWVKGFTNDSFNNTLEIYGQWTDTTTNLTTVTTSVGNVAGQAIGSFLRLTPLNTNG